MKDIKLARIISNLLESPKGMLYIRSYKYFKNYIKTEHIYLYYFLKSQ
jgi:hypothetical protein